MSGFQEYASIVKRRRQNLKKILQKLYSNLVTYIIYTDNDIYIITWIFDIIPFHAM